MAVPHQRHIVVCVEIRAPGIVVEILHPPAHDFQRALVGKAQVLSQQHAPLLESLPFLGRKAIPGNAQQEIRIRRKACPHRSLGSVSDSGKVRAKIQQIENDLEMNMRRPAAILLTGPDAANLLAARNSLANLKAAKRLSCEMSVQREELFSVACVVPQNHQRTVILRGSIVCEKVHLALERCPHRRARLNKEVHSQMNRATLPDRIVHAPKTRGAVQRSRFVVTPDAHAHARSLHLAKYRFCQRRGFRRTGIRSEKQAADTKIKHETRFGPHIDVQDGRRSFPVFLDRALDLLCLGDRRASARGAKRVVGKARVNFCGAIILESGR